MNDELDFSLLAVLSYHDHSVFSCNQKCRNLWIKSKVQDRMNNVYQQLGLDLF